MRIRNPLLLKLAGRAAALTARGLARSLRLEVYYVGPVVAPLGDVPPGPRYLYAVWHEHLLLPTSLFGHPDLAVLVSKHSDGQLLGSLLKTMRVTQVAGSTNRGGVQAVRRLLRDPAGWRHLSITPDGPRGPRRRVQEGVPYIASRAGFEVVPIGIGHRNPWRLKSWDRFAVPKPFARARIVCGAPITVPPGLRSAELELYRQMIEAEMLRLTDVAQEWADTGRMPDVEAAAEARRAA